MRRMLKLTLLVTVFVIALAAPALAQATDDYTVTVGGEVVTRADGGTGSGQLPFTGSNNTPSLVAIGLAAVVVGGVIVVAARRRSQVLVRT